jgi:tetratricopeptide (TPR) repeat protein
MKNIEHALILSAAKNERSNKQVLLLVLAALSILPVLLLLFTVTSSEDDLADTARLAAAPTATKLAERQVEVIVVPPQTLPPGLDLKQAIADYIKRTSVLIQHPRFGNEAAEALRMLKELDDHLLNMDPASQSAFFQQETIPARQLAEKVEVFRNTLLQNIAQAYPDRNAKAFTLGLREYKALGADQELVAQWLEFEYTAGEIFEKLRKVEAYRRTNDLEGELSMLREVMALGFKEVGLSDRVRELEVLSRKMYITRRLNRAQLLYSSGEFSKAFEELSTLLKMDPDNTQAKSLIEKAQIALDASTVNDLVAKAAQAIASDDWKAAKDLYSKALAIDANNKNALDGRQLSEEIIGVNTHMEGLLNAPERLSDRQVAKYAKELLDKAADHFEFSASLQHLAGELEHALMEWGKLAKVFVKSDGKARIEVRGVGYIEPTLEKTIELLPGSYAFYAHCKGRVVEQVFLEVPINQPVVGVNVVCGREI